MVNKILSTFNPQTHNYLGSIIPIRVELRSEETRMTITNHMISKEI